MKQLLVLGLIALLLALGGCVPDMHDCCQCLYEANELTCTEPEKECVDQCADQCSEVDACRCSAARRADCSAECGCDLEW